jgi:HPt (histidine-containing phosphotransfer) domain-containing protein
MAGPIDDATFANLLEMTGGDQFFVDELVDTYIDEGERLVAGLAAAATAGSIEDMVRPAHSMKSSSLNVGALDLGELCRALETDARGGDVDDPVARAAAVERGFGEARDELLAERRRRG